MKVLVITDTPEGRKEQIYEDIDLKAVKVIEHSNGLLMVQFGEFDQLFDVFKVEATGFDYQNANVCTDDERKEADDYSIEHIHYRNKFGTKLWEEPMQLSSLYTVGDILVKNDISYKVKRVAVAGNIEHVNLDTDATIIT